MESGKELRTDGFSSLGSSLDGQPPTEQAEDKPEDSLSEGHDSQASLSQRKKEKKREKHADLEHQDSMTTSLNSAPSNVDSSLNNQAADIESSPNESQNSETELVKVNTESPADVRNHVKCSPVKTDRSPESAVKSDDGSNYIKINLEHSSKNGTENQQASGAFTEAKMEENSSKKDDTVSEQTGTSKDQGNNTVAKGQSVRSKSNTQTLFGHETQSVSHAKNISTDLHSDVKPSVMKDAKLSGQDKKQEIKESKSEIKESQKTNVEEAAKQQSGVSNLKNVSKAGKVSEKVEQASSPAQNSEQEKMTNAKGQEKKQTNQKDEGQQTSNKVKQSDIDFADRVIVYFHAILSKDFKLDPEKHKIFIRAAGISGYEDWENICELTCSEASRSAGHRRRQPYV